MTRISLHVVLVASAGLLAPRISHADAQSDATALFDQAGKDLAAGNVELACKEFAASLAQFQDSGTKGALASCYQKLGKTVSAWNLWRDLADTDPDPALKKDAAANAYELEARLPRFVIRLEAAPPAGLSVSINGVAAADPTLAVPLPVDPGPFTVVAAAPDHETWIHTFDASEGKVTKVEVPALKAKPKPVVPASPAGSGGVVPTTVIVREDTEGTRHSRHVIGASLGIVGIAAAGVGLYFGDQASTKWNTAKTACGGSVTTCPGAMSSVAEGSVKDARTAALVSTIAVSAGAALLVTGAIVWFSAPSGDAERSGLHVAPVVGAQQVGLSLSGAWR